MKRLTTTDLDNLLVGTIFYGTGGGGSPSLAKAMYQQLAIRNRSLILEPISAFAPNDTLMTTFPVGGLEPQDVPDQYLRRALAMFQRRCKAPIAGIIPVEIGPLSVAVAAKLAVQLKLPLLDADIVGGRSTPEVFLETITLFDISRTPLVVVNASGEYGILEKSSSADFEEDFLRSFANKSGGFSYVFGYPMTASVVRKAVTSGTVTQAIQTGRLINSNQLLATINSVNGKIMFSGTISSIRSQKQSGFTSQYIDVKNKTQKARVYVKNENLILWIDGKSALTCPDLIVLLDGDDKPLFNLDLKIGLTVTVIGVKACPLWRTSKGEKLFCPRTFGFQFDPKLL